ncbi:MAG: glycosyltransferase [Okeania sp. SIO2G4]|nr:glycosyltransferase [Okeania sp. SIO4D6]NEP42440.1 glycosyltransferase [Okeania sp. SIO2H7]NEP75190.1 glycosyltransferase [Okeania sp. SIO2G5]NEP96240.1 glycosyltransferase [Okeania sp. SIO2F5]NEQ93986.1 glycosyltransferase [Okeania sp. SIO2G4]
MSVIIPVYNGEKYVTQAIDSVINQNYTDYEIIVVDDGSRDSTQKVLESYSSKINYFYQDNQGSAAARNRGIESANGDLIAFLDADDFFLSPDKLSQQVKYFEQDAELGSVHTGWQLVNHSGESISDICPWEYAPKLDLETWLKWKPVLTSTMMVRRSWLMCVGGFDIALRQCHDVDLVLRLALEGCKFEWLRQIAVAYRLHQGNTTANSIQQSKYAIAVLDKFFARDDLPKFICKIESEIRYHTLVWVAWYEYYHYNYQGMAEYLKDSLKYTPYWKAQTIADWINKFTQFSGDRDHEINFYYLTELPEWQNLVGAI